MSLCLLEPLPHAALQKQLQGQCVQTLESSEHPPQAGCLIGSALTMMSSLHVIRALTNSLGDTLEETLLS